MSLLQSKFRSGIYFVFVFVLLIIVVQVVATSQTTSLTDAANASNTVSVNFPAAATTSGLCSLYTSSNGGSWTNDTGWKDGCSSAAGNTSANACQWYGISCDPSTGAVIGVDLSFNGLTGNVRFEDIANQLQTIAATLQTLRLGSNYGYWMAFPQQTDVNGLAQTLDAFTALEWDLSALFPRLEVLDLHWIVNSGFLPTQFPSSLRYLELSSRWTLRRDFFRLYGTKSDPARPTDSRLGVSGTITQQMLQAFGNSLEHLGLSGSNVTYDSSVSLSSFCLPKLTYLDLLWQPLQSFDQGAEVVPTHFNSSLSTLLLPRRSVALNISDMVQMLGVKYPALRELALSATDLTDGPFPSIGEFPASLSWALPKLEYLTLTHFDTGRTTLPSSWSVLPLWFISLRDTQVQGQIPSEWSAFTNCESFDVSVHYLEATGSNYDQGALPPQLFVNWTQLRYLRLDPATDRQSLLTIGALPSLADSPLIFTLYISDCRGTTTGGWTGTLPAGIANMTSLDTVNMGCSGLSGSIAVFSRLTKIRNLNIASVPMEGSFEPDTAWPQLEELLLSGCGIIGPLPSGVLKSKTLGLVRIDNNQLEGDGAPWELLQAEGLTLFDASNNRFTDAGLLSSANSVPDFIFPSLTTFSLRSNRLNISAAYLRVFFASPKLSILDLGQNKITMFLNEPFFGNVWCSRGISNSLLSIIRIDNNEIGKGLALPSTPPISVSTVAALSLFGSCFANLPHLTQVRMQNNGMRLCPLPDGFLDWLAKKFPAFTLCERQQDNTTATYQQSSVIDQIEFVPWRPQAVTWMEPLEVLFHCSVALHGLNGSGSIDELIANSQKFQPTPEAWWRCATEYMSVTSSFRFAGTLLKDEPIRFGALVSADVSGNPLAFVFPNLTIPTASLSARVLQLADFHNMDLRGEVGLMLSWIPGLRFDQNPRMRSRLRNSTTGRLTPPAFAQITYTTLLRLERQHLLCPNFNRSDGGDIIALDASYLAYEGCSCESRMVWVPVAQTCMQCPPQIECDTAVFRPTHRIRPGYYPLFPDCGLTRSSSSSSLGSFTARWQVDSVGCSAQHSTPSTLSLMQSDLLLNATIVPCWGGLTACPNVNEPSNATQATTLTANAGEFDGNATASSETFSCANGHDSGSFLCSSCLRGYYPFSNDCLECPNGESWFAGTTMAVGSITIVIFCFLQAGSGTLDGKPTPRYTFPIGAVIQSVLLWQQSLGVLTTVGIRPPTHLWRDTLTSLSNFSPIAIECIDPTIDARAQFLIMAAIFATLSVVALGSALISAFRTSNASRHVVTRVLRSSLLLLLFMYVPLFQRALQQLRYTSVDVLAPPQLSSIINSTSTENDNGNDPVSDMILWPNYRSTMVRLYYLVWIPYQSGAPTELHALFDGWSMPVAAFVACAVIVVPICLALLFSCSNRYKRAGASAMIDSTGKVDPLELRAASVYPADSRLHDSNSEEIKLNSKQMYRHSLAEPLLLQSASNQDASLSLSATATIECSSSILRNWFFWYRPLPEDESQVDDHLLGSASNVSADCDISMSATATSKHNLSESLVHFLSQSCRPTCWWYSVVYVPLFRKLTFVSAAVLFPRTALLVLLLLFAVLFVAFALQLHVRPFQRMLDNMVELVLLAHLLATFQLEVVATALQSALSGSADSGGAGSYSGVGGLASVDVDASSSNLDAARSSLLYVQDAILAVVTICAINEAAFQFRIFSCRHSAICGEPCCRKCCKRKEDINASGNHPYC